MDTTAWAFVSSLIQKSLFVLICFYILVFLLKTAIQFNSCIVKKPKSEQEAKF